MGVGEDGPVRGDEDVARQREFKAAGDRSSVDRPDHRLVDRGPRVPGRSLRQSRVAGPRILGPELFEVDARTERRIGAGQEQRRRLRRRFRRLAMARCNRTMRPEFNALRDFGRFSVTTRGRAVAPRENEVVGHGCSVSSKGQEMVAARCRGPRGG